MVEPAHFLNMVNHPIKNGDQGGRFQLSHGKPRYLLDAPIKTGGKSGPGSQGGSYQGPKSNPRYLLHKKK